MGELGIVVEFRLLYGSAAGTCDKPFWLLDASTQEALEVQVFCPAGDGPGDVPRELGMVLVPTEAYDSLDISLNRSRSVAVVTVDNEDTSID